jgi:hypothetical protein
LEQLEDLSRSAVFLLHCSSTARSSRDGHVGTEKFGRCVTHCEAQP